MTISKDFLYYYGDCFRLFLQIGWQNYFNIMIFLLKYTYILICMWQNVRYNFFDFCLGSGYMCQESESENYSSFIFFYYFHYMHLIDNLWEQMIRHMLLIKVSFIILSSAAKRYPSDRQGILFEFWIRHENKRTL